MQIEHHHLKTFADDVINLSREVANEKRKQVNTLRDRLETHIAANPGFALVKMLHAGSVAKGTALRTVNDFDVAVYVRSEDAPADASLIDWMTERLREAYEGLIGDDQVQSGTHCVTITFKGTGTVVDVVPVLYEGDPDDRGYLVARDTGDRLLTSVRLHLEFIRKRKAAAPTDFAQIVRFVKWWIRNQKIEHGDQFRFKSFMAELIVADMIDNGAVLSDYVAGLEAFFSGVVNSELRGRIAFADYYNVSELPAAGADPIEIIDPVNPENNAARLYTESDRKRIVYSAEDALDAIAEARYATTKARAVDCWQVVLGERFKGASS
ncbi:CBASS oligonucleotide cyclase [Candidatus Poriferisodalis sp.]|uniref:CBASS oligonucleotide cyclase n=1 Tax=Candidatus Poriferisodalis sp. TaxID=3101277 RepID=UPI003D0996B8